ncbi:hypothetical protein EHP00_1538 [Ecytonucleospora hepatopenaei]|uniref:Uncharacterized protein n=1 Tax=Ecytonucleospora hepatopenaei TaxID=646526 RepID=A0A1W0E373_9MICR|nr:hypothetical protein EHP00_1538 [Ecytonucleospora hepatopenaei]
MSNILFLLKYISCSDSDNGVDSNISDDKNSIDSIDKYNYTNSSNSDLKICDERTCYNTTNCIESGLEKCETKVTNMEGRRRTNELNKKYNTDRFWYQRDIDEILCKRCDKQCYSCVCNKYNNADYVSKIREKEKGVLYIPKGQQISIHKNLNVKVVTEITSVNQTKYKSIDEILEQDKSLFYAAYVQISNSIAGPVIYLIKKYIKLNDNFSVRHNFTHYLAKVKLSRIKFNGQIIQKEPSKCIACMKTVDLNCSGVLNQKHVIYFFKKACVNYVTNNDLYEKNDTHKYEIVKFLYYQKFEYSYFMNFLRKKKFLIKEQYCDKEEIEMVRHDHNYEYCCITDADNLLNDLKYSGKFKTENDATAYIESFNNFDDIELSEL